LNHLVNFGGDGGRFLGGSGDMGIGNDALAFLGIQGCLLEGAVAPVEVVPKQQVEALVAWDGWNWLFSSQNIVKANFFGNLSLGDLDFLLVVQNRHALY
jgi:hypothetical protein